MCKDEEDLKCTIKLTEMNFYSGRIKNICADESIQENSGTQ